MSEDFLKRSRICYVVVQIRFVLLFGIPQNMKSKNAFKALATSSSSDDEEDDQSEVSVDEEVETARNSIKKTRITLTESEISFMTYNVLADHLCKPAWFPYRSKEELQWKMRREIIKKQILSFNCSVVCLQEIQVFHGPEHLRGQDHHFSWFDKWMREEGKYTGVFGSRTTAEGKHQPGIQMGNLLYWKDDSFEPILVQPCVPLLKTIANEAYGDKEMKKMYCNSGIRATAASMAVLRCRTSNRVILVATTHLPAPRSDLDGMSHLEQLLHAYALLKEISLFSKRVSEGVDTIIVLGDLNSLPNNSVCNLFERGILDKKLVGKVLQLGGRFRAPFVDKDTGNLISHPILLRNLSLKKNRNKTKKSKHFFKNAFSEAGVSIDFTNYTEKFRGWLDHIYFMTSPDTILEIKAHDPSNGVTTYLPDIKAGFGSDHLPLVCTFKLTPTSSQQEANLNIDFIEVSPVELPAENSGVNSSIIDLNHESDLDYLLVDDERKMDKAFEELYFEFDELKHGFIFDAFGPNLSRIKPMTFLCIQRISLSQLERSIVQSKSSKIFMFHLKQLKKRGKPKLPRQFQQLLESRNFLKLTFDVRFDADALFHQYNITISNVLDLQIWHQAIRLQRGVELSEPHDNKIPFVPRFRKTLLEFLPEKNLPPNMKGADDDIWNSSVVPESVIQFALNEVIRLKELFFAMQQAEALSKYLIERIESHSRRYIRVFKERTLPVNFETDRNFVLEEHSIKQEWPDEHNEPSGINRWLQLNIFRLTQ